MKEKMINIQKRLLAITQILLFFTLTIYAQEYKISKETFGSGTKAMAGSEYKVIGTISQSFIGVSENNDNKCLAGFWTGMKMAPISVEWDIFSEKKSIIIYPNPFENYLYIEFFSENENHVELTLKNILEQNSATIFIGYSVKGTNTIKYSNNDIPAGMYYLLFDNGNFTKTILIIKL